MPQPGEAIQRVNGAALTDKNTSAQSSHGHLPKSWAKYSISPRKRRQSSTGVQPPPNRGPSPTSMTRFLLVLQPMIQAALDVDRKRAETEDFQQLLHQPAARHSNHGDSGLDVLHLPVGPHNRLFRLVQRRLLRATLRGFFFLLPALAPTSRRPDRPTHPARRAPGTHKQLDPIDVSERDQACRNRFSKSSPSAAFPCDCSDLANPKSDQPFSGHLRRSSR